MKIDEDGNLRIQNRFGEIVEKKPIAWVDGRNGKEAVEVQFELLEKRSNSFFLMDMTTSKKLVIDPNLTFSSFTGSTADNWGFTAAPDALVIFLVEELFLERDIQFLLERMMELSMEDRLT